LKAFVPQASRIAVLINPTNPLHQREQAKLPEFGRLLGVELVIVEASTPDQFETAFEAAREQGAEGIQVVGDALTFTHSAMVVSLAARYRLPAMYLDRRNVQDGGLISYGPNAVGLWRRAGTYVDKILKGEKAGDLPVQQPTRFDLIVNLKTAAELGITVPPSTLAQAEEVIE
jgi:putative ABC transport system substrate-binding protein